MRYAFRTFVAIVAAAAVAGSALAVECTPVAPKDVTGGIRFIHPGASVAISFFEGNDCSWNGADPLNGTDGLALDVAGLGGTTGSVTATLATGVPPSLLGVAIDAYFLDEACTKIQGSDFDFGTSLPDSAESEPVTIPDGAKWFVATSTTDNATNEVSVALHSNGKDCPAPKVKKKKKKRKSG